MENSMGNKFHRNPVQIPSTTQARLDEAFAELKNRELLYNRGKKELGIKIDDELIIPKPRVDEFNVTFNEDDEIALKDDITVDSVTARADREGVDWKSQTVLAETTEERTIILICAKDNDKETGMVGFFGGEIVELGEDVESHYQVSLTSTGSRLIKGATTNKKKAKPCFVKYNGDYYYGIHFKESSPAKIYHAGWSNIPGPLAAPSYTTYTDGDFSEIVDLDDDSETGTEVIELSWADIESYNWEFIGELTSRQTVNFRNNFNTTGSGNNRYYSLASNIRLYPVNRSGSNSSTVELHPEWGSITVEGRDVTNVRFAITDDVGYVTLRLKNWGGMNSNIPRQGANMVIYPDNGTGTAPNTAQQLESHYFPYAATGTDGYVSDFTFGPLPRGTYWIRQGSGGYNTKVEYYILQTETYAGEDEMATAGDYYNYDFQHGLKIKTHNDIHWEFARNDNTGVIICDAPTNELDSEGLLQVEVLGPCRFTVGFSKLPDDEAPTATLLMSESLEAGDEAWARAVQGHSQSDTTITDVTYTYSGKWGKKQTLYIATDRPAAIYYAAIEYPSFSGGAIIADIIRGLDETGEDGSPHIIRPSGVIDKASIMTIAGVCLNSERQLVIDLSNCTAAADAVNWTNDAQLQGAFQGCSSLQSFKYPSGVTFAGKATFLNCSFLREVEFNDEALQLGRDAEWTTQNQGFFSGARIKQIWMPRELGRVRGSNNNPMYPLGSYVFAQNNILGYYIRPDSYYARNNSANDFDRIFNNSNWGVESAASWNTFSYARRDFKIYLPCKKLPNGDWDTSTSWVYNTWKNRAAALGSTFGPLMNAATLDQITENVPSLMTTDRVVDFLAPYDVNEEWYIPRGLDPV